MTTSRKTSTGKSQKFAAAKLVMETSYPDQPATFAPAVYKLLEGNGWRWDDHRGVWSRLSVEVDAENEPTNDIGTWMGVSPGYVHLCHTCGGTGAKWFSDQLLPCPDCDGSGINDDDALQSSLQPAPSFARAWKAKARQQRSAFHAEVAFKDAQIGALVCQLAALMQRYEIVVRALEVG